MIAAKKEKKKESEISKSSLKTNNTPDKPAIEIIQYKKDDFIYFKILPLETLPYKNLI